ncbi:MAG TPA: GNAT family N-acetyltransferase [Clostridia bacterium]|nr:GNAT family N-acetyltransferase [Clostridia bacterium]
MIRVIDNKNYIRFLTSNQAQKKQVSLNDKGTHYGYYEDDKLLGVISVADTKNVRRAKGFLVNERQQNRGIGTKLLEHIIVDDKDMTAFATVYSFPLLSKLGFRAESKNANNITFMRRPAPGKFVITEKEIEHIKPQLAELAKQILLLDREKQRATTEYTCKKLKELIR